MEEKVASILSSSSIKTLCDCPYVGKIREVKSSSEDENKRRKKLQRKIKETKDEIVLSTKVLVDVHGQLAMFKQFLNSELGLSVNPYIGPETSRKDRVWEESYLKSELIHLVDYLRHRDSRYRKDPACHPTKLSASADDLLFVTQEMFLKDLYHGYAEYRSENEKTTATCLRDFLDLKENYENRLYCNKIMEREIEDIQRKIAQLQQRFLEDKSLIEFITAHHFKMKGTFLEDRDPTGEYDQTIDVEDSEAMEFKKLWEKSSMEKANIQDSVDSLKIVLESASRRLVRAETACSNNVMNLRSLVKKMQQGIALFTLTIKTTDNLGKFPVVPYETQRSQLEAAKKENQYLRNFLRKAILSKTLDLGHMQSSLQTTAEGYRSTLEGIRNSLTAKPQST